MAESTAELAEALAELVATAELAEKLAEAFREEQTVARVEKRALARLEVDTREKPILVPEQDQDVHDLKGLAAVADAILPAGTAASRARAR